MVVKIPQSHYDRVGKLIGDIEAARLNQKSVYEALGIPKTTWNNVKRGNGAIADKTYERVLHDAEIYVSGILRELRNEG